MPLYEYVCADCCKSFEALQRMGEGSTDVACPHCRGSQVERQLSTFSGLSSSGSTGARSASASGCQSPFT